MINRYYIKPGGSNEIIYLRPAPDGVTLIQNTGDSAWNYVNQPDTYVPPSSGVPAFLDPVNPHMLLNNNIFGHKWRRTGINGGYYDINTAQYKLANGTVSNQATTFGTAVGLSSYLIDHHTGLGWKWNAQGATIFSTHITNIATLNGGTGWAGYYDWFLPNINQLRSITSYESPGIIYTTTFAPFNTAGNVKSSTHYLSVASTHIGRAGVNFTNRADGTADNAFLCRFHFV